MIALSLTGYDRPTWTEHDLQLLSRLFKLLSSPARIDILLALAKHEYSVMELAEHLGYTQSAISHHLSLLSAHGLICQHRVGRWHFYTLADEAILNILTSGMTHILNTKTR